MELVLVFILIIIPCFRTETNFNGSNCLIHNNRFQFEYLYSSVSKRDTKSVYLMPLKDVNDFNQIRWSLIQAGKKYDNQFYLKSSLFDDYLCASSNFDNLFLTRRIVNRLQLINPNIIELAKCRWNINKVDSKKTNNKYLIMNHFYKESLYAVSYIFQTKTKKREIFVTNMNYLRREKYEWIIDCQTGKYLLY